METDLKKEIKKSEMNKSVKEKHLNEEYEKIENLVKACHQIKRYYDKNEMDKIIHKLNGIQDGIDIAKKLLE